MFYVKLIWPSDVIAPININQDKQFVKLRYSVLVTIIVFENNSYSFYSSASSFNDYMCLELQQYLELFAATLMGLRK